MTKPRFQNLLLEPYRLFFALGSIYSIVAVGFWFTWLHLADHRLLSWTGLIPPQRIHAHMMIYGVIGFYIFGFILTAFPRFVSESGPGKYRIVGWSLGLLASQFFLILGGFSDRSYLIPAGLFEGGTYASLLVYLSSLYLRSETRPMNKQPFYLLVALGSGTLGIFFFYFSLLSSTHPKLYIFGTELGMYGYLLFLVVGITYRVVPFFSGRVIQEYQGKRGKQTLKIVLILILLRLGCLIFIQSPEALFYATRIADMLLFGTLLREWLRWHPFKATQFPLLLILYLGLFWILLFLGFSGWELISSFIHPDQGYPVWQTALLHSFFVGALGTLLIAISTRVVRGHGGLPLVPDKFVLASMILIQIAAIWRVVTPFLEPYFHSYWVKNYWSGFFWCLAFSIWTIRYIPFLFRAIPQKSPDSPKP